MKNYIPSCLISIFMVFSLVGNVIGSEIPELKQVYKDYFLVGGALNRNLVYGKDPNAAEIAITQFNTVTSENDMKWSSIHPWPDRYNWEPADRFVDFALHNKMVPIGHCLVWHSQVPRWTFSDNSGNPLTRETLLTRMKEHITSVVGRYRGESEGLGCRERGIK